MFRSNIDDMMSRNDLRSIIDDTRSIMSQDDSKSMTRYDTRSTLDFEDDEPSFAINFDNEETSPITNNSHRTKKIGTL